jgi:hypothetical protein
VRLAGLTDDLIVRDQLLDLAQEWMLTARRARRPSDDTRVVSLHKNLGHNVVPLHTNQDVGVKGAGAYTATCAVTHPRQDRMQESRTYGSERHHDIAFFVMPITVAGQQSG